MSYLPDPVLVMAIDLVLVMAIDLPLMGRL